MKLLFVAVACQILNVPVKGRRIGKGRHYSDVVRFRCVRGYRMIGSASRSCQANGLWSGQQPMCIRKKIVYSHKIYILLFDCCV